MKLMWRGVVSCIEQHGRLILGLMQKRLIPKWGLAIPRLEVKLTWKIVIILGHRYDNEVDILNEALEMYAFYSHECLESCVIGCKKRRAKAVALLKKGRSASADA